MQWLRRFNRDWRFTREGWVFVVIVFGLGVAAINTGSNLLFLMFSIALSMIILSGILSSWVLSRVVFKDISVPYLQVDEQGFVVVQLMNPRVFGRAYSIEVALEIDRPNIHHQKGFVIMILPGQQVDVSVRIQGIHRGEYTIKNVRIDTKYPFSFFQKSMIWEVNLRSVVLPKPIIAMQNPSVSSKGSDVGLNRVGREGDFRGVREYRWGDDPKQIHYRLSAKARRLLLVEVEAMKGKTITLGIKNWGPRDVVENRIGKAAYLVQKALRQGLHVRLVSAKKASELLTSPSDVLKGLIFLGRLEVLDRASGLLMPVDWEIE